MESKTRRYLDSYYTEEPLTERLLSCVPQIQGTVLECCAGQGAMANVLSRSTRIDKVYCMDINLEVLVSGEKNLLSQGWPLDNMHCADATIPETWDNLFKPGRTWIDGANPDSEDPEFTRPDWVITNPPFTSAPQILPLALEHCFVGVAFLMRLSYLEPAGNRGDWLQTYSDQMRHLIVFGQPRPSFTGNGRHDSCTVAWMVWQKNWSWNALGVASPFQFTAGWRLSPLAIA